MTTTRSDGGDSAHEKFEERRLFPRITPAIPFDLILSGGNHIERVVYDISPDGMQLRCDREDATKLHPSGEFIREPNVPEIELAIRLPIDNQPINVQVSCSLRYVAVLESKQIAFGVRFESMDSAHRTTFDLFMSTALIPAP